MAKDVLYVVTSATGAARDVPKLVELAVSDGWDAWVVGTPNSAGFLDVPTLEALTGHGVQFQYRKPDEPRKRPAADAVLVAGASFNTINKWALGVADNLALSLLCEVIGYDVPVVLLPFVNQAMARHPALARGYTVLREMGVKLIADEEGNAPPSSSHRWAASRNLSMAARACSDRWSSVWFVRCWVVTRIRAAEAKGVGADGEAMSAKGHYREWNNAKMPSNVTAKLSVFDRFATHASAVVSRAGFFTSCVLLVVLWAPSFILLGSVDTWQLVINTVTTIITFLLVALLQNTQTRTDEATEQKLNAIAKALAEISGHMAKDYPELSSVRKELHDAVGLEDRESA